ncbi:MAG: glycosyltransferase [Tabrizicola sp.]|nr:glycosyltransferase [Tabrizicola sp.]
MFARTEGATAEDRRSGAPVVYDVTRLFLGPLSRTPRGIDRVDITLARHFFAHARRDCVGIMPSTLGVRVFDRERVLRGLERLQVIWAEADHANERADRALGQLKASLAGKSEQMLVAADTRDLLAQKMRRMLSLLGATGFSFGRSPRSRVPKGAVYINVGHYGLAVPMFLNWLRRRADVTCVFMLHDVIPVEMPHFVEPSSARHHATMVSSTARYADGLLISTHAARDAVAAALRAQGREKVAILPHPLPLTQEFDEDVPRGNLAPSAPYFVICGSIEPRKNHALLVKVWELLVDRMGERAPPLVVIGSLGWEGQAILEQFGEERRIARRIHVVSGLATPAMKRLVADAAGLLMPSFAEGYGFPLVEAARLGVPVIASDIPAHREVARPGSVLLKPDDATAWAETIQLWLESDKRPAVSRMTSADVLNERQAYLRAVETFVDECAASDTYRGSRVALSVRDVEMRGSPESAAQPHGKAFP